MFLCRSIRQHWLLTVLLPLLAMTVAYLAALQLPPVYVAQGSVRLGRVDGGEAVSLAGAVTRINSPSFKQRVVRSMNLSGAESARAAALTFASLVAKQETPDTVAVAFVRPPPASESDGSVVSLPKRSSRDDGALMADIKQQLAAGDANIVSPLQARRVVGPCEEEPKTSCRTGIGNAAVAWLSDLVSATAKAGCGKG